MFISQAGNINFPHSNLPTIRGCYHERIINQEVSSSTPLEDLTKPHGSVAISEIRGAEKEYDERDQSSLPTANLDVIDYRLLLERDQAVVTKLLSACKSHGFFYLDLSSQSVCSILDQWETTLALMKQWFSRPLEEKLEGFNGSDRLGYKPMGTHAGITKNSRDGWESFRFAKDQKHVVPQYLRKNAEIFANFQSSCQDVTMTILACLSDALGLDPSCRLENSHRDGHPSATNTMFLRYPENKSGGQNAGQNKHTDIGTLTLLFCKQEGLEALDPVTKDWAAVKPKPGHAIVNVGDALRFLSGFQLKSALHRVVPTHSLEHRFSVAHFLRPEDQTTFVDSKGRTITAVEWHDGKHETFKSSHEKQQELGFILTGGMEAKI